MYKCQITIIDNGLTEEQKLKLTSLEFKADNSIPTEWIYNAADTQDLVSVTEDLDLCKCLSKVARKFRFGKRV